MATFTRRKTCDKMIKMGILEVIMESFLISCKVVVPMALTVAVGVLLRIYNMTDVATMKKVDNLIFKLFMPCMSFYNIYRTDFTRLTNVSYILYGVFALFLLFVFSIVLVPKFVKPAPTGAAFGQAVFRSNYLIFGAAVAETMYGQGNIGMVTLLGSVAVPMYNILSVILMENARQGAASLKKLILAIGKNPTVIATVLGIAVNLSGLVVPELVLDVVQDLSGLTTPLSFLSIGVSLSFSAAVSKRGYLATGVLLRLVLVPLVLMPPAIWLGFHGQELCALLILLAAPVAVSSYPTAVTMGADGEFAAQLVAYTTILCLPTIFLWTLLLNSMGLL